MATLILNASEILTMAGPDGPRSGKDKGSLGLLRDGAVLIEKGRIVAAGPKARVLSEELAKGAKILSAEGRVLMPGFVDAHTHPVFAAPRLDDFEGRIAGKTYAELAQKGGGILSTVNGVRGSKEADLAAGLRMRALDFVASGTTTIEAKSGYGLDLDNELKLLRVMRTVSARGPLEIVPTFLGAHAVPPEFKGRKAEFVDRVCASSSCSRPARGQAGPSPATASTSTTSSSSCARCARSPGGGPSRSCRPSSARTPSRPSTRGAKASSSSGCAWR